MTTDLPQDFCPYKGLQPYTENDRAYFFGRERDQEIIISNLYASHLTVLYGASGVGKSSVLLAGAVPQLRREPRLAVVVFRNWQDLSFVPALKQEVLTAVRESMGREAGEARALSIDASLPFDEFLAHAARTLGGPIFLIFDQFEEYFLYHPQSDDADSFESEFARAVNRRDVDVNFLLSMREDGLSKLDRFQGRIPTLLSNMLRLEHLDRAAAKDAITKPLEEYNRDASDGLPPITIETKLTEGLLDDLSAARTTSDQAGQGTVSSDGYKPVTSEANIETPFLQMVLTRLWDEEKAAGSRVLRLETFVRLGGAENIARTHLDKMMEKLTETERSTAASVLRYLVTPSGTKIAQEPAALVSWADLKEDEVQAILRRLSASDTRILRTVQVPGQPVRYEIFHDVMAQAILDWRNRYVQEQKRLEAERQIAAERALAQQQLARQRKRAKQLRLIAAGLALLTVLMIFLAVKWYHLKYAALSRELAAYSLSSLETDPELSLLLAIEAVNARPTGMAKDALKAALLESHVSAVMGTKDAGRIAGVSFSPDGRYVATASWYQDHTARVWLAETGKSVSVLTGAQSQVNTVSFSPDGKYLATSSDDKVVRVWEGWQTTTPSLVKTMVQDEGVTTAMFSPDQDGQYLLTGGYDGKVRVWEWKNDPPSLKAEIIVASALASADPSPSPESKIATSPEIAAANPTVSDARKVPSKVPIPCATPEASPTSARVTVWKAAFSPDGKEIIIASGSRKVLVWKWTEETNNFFKLSGHESAVYDAAFSPSGLYAVTGSKDTKALVWEVKNAGVKKAELNLLPNIIRGVAFSFDGKFVATASYDKLARVWEWGLGNVNISETSKSDAGKKALVLRGHAKIVICAAFSPDGKFVVTGSEDGTARVWRTQRLDKNWLDSLSVDELLELARKRITRPLTPEEKAKYLSQS